MFEEKKAKHIKSLNKALKFAKSHPLKLKIARLDPASFPIIIGFSDASFANNHELSTQLGHIVFLPRKAERRSQFTLNHIRQEGLCAQLVIAFIDMFDVAITLSEEIKDLYGKDTPLQLFTDSKPLFDVISKGSRTSENRLMLDIAAAREGFGDRLISRIGFVRSDPNIADGLTKPI